MEKIFKTLIVTNIKRINTNIKLLVVFSLAFVFFGVLPAVAQGASLFFSPSSGSYQIDQNFSVAINVSSPEQSINAVSGVISFPANKLEVVSISRVNSRVNFWTQEPSFSNTLGSIDFEGIILNPGFQGQSGEIITIGFRVKGSGVETISLVSGSILANDGLGTNIISGLGQAVFSLGSSAGQTSIGSISGGLPGAPIITSVTHPDPAKWYNLPDVKFNWKVPEGITAVRILYDKYPYSIPSVIYGPGVNTKEINGIKDGTWYFHVQFQNANGWGAISHFRFQIDTQPPIIPKINFVTGKESFNPRPEVLFNTKDDLSGVYYYRIKIGDGGFFERTMEEIIRNNPYILPDQSPGKRSFLVQAFDYAGNSATAIEEFEIKALDEPILSEYSKNLAFGEPLIIKGVACPECQIRISWQHEDGHPKSEIVNTDTSGSFVFIQPGNFVKGSHTFWMEVFDKSGAKSLVTKPIEFFVEPPALIKFGSIAIDYLTVIICVLALLIVIGVLIILALRGFKSFKTNIKKQISEAVYKTEESLDILRRDVTTQIETLEEADAERKLTSEENRVLKNLKDLLERIERRGKSHMKKVRDIGDVI
jgi:hypothetical protein